MNGHTGDHTPQVEGQDKPDAGNSRQAEGNDKDDRPQSAEDRRAEQEPGRGERAAVPAAPPSPIIVGIGASAGGLEAFTALLQYLPADTGLALVFVQHLAARHESVLPHLLAAATGMPVLQAAQDMPLQPNRVYVIPPGARLEIDRGRFRLSPRPEGDGIFLPVDDFFRSLANYARQRAIGVVLSGTASDGAKGLREIRAQGGVALVQDSDEARYDGMPRGAIASGAVDLQLPLHELARELVRLSRNPFDRRPQTPRSTDELQVGESELEEIFGRLRKASGVDFSRYKPGTIKRRLQRRMLLNRVTDIPGYIKFLKEHPAEIETLHQDILIHVTRFFREPDSFEALKATVLPRILERRDESIRIWVPGCASGEEVYSVAIALLEVLDERGDSTPIQIFGTDVSDEAIEQARRGVFNKNIVNELSQERLLRFFTKTDGRYRVARNVRDLCVFARQDITRDPPFSNLDLVMCRNVLIYLGAELQKKVLGFFHYALHEHGFLMLGSAETVGAQSDLFTAVNKHQHIFAKLPGQSPRTSVPLGYGLRRGYDAHPNVPSRQSPVNEAEHLLLDTYAPSAVLVNDELRIVHTHGKTGYYLELSAGNPDLHLLKMARQGLLHALRSMLHKARRDDRPQRKEGLRVSLDGDRRLVNLAVRPLRLDDARHFLIVFEDVTQQMPRDAGGSDEAVVEISGDKACAERVMQLQQELDENRDYLKSTVQDLEAANEELQSANEEILSSNEELQSTNEELDTAKEELQSTNEELNTVNEELHARNDELTLANSDLGNLLASVNIAIVMVSLDLHIRRFTPMAEQMLNLIQTDVDRPIGHIKPNIDCPDLEELIGRVIDRVEPIEREVRDANGRWYSLRIRPYKGLDNRIDGAVLVLFDIDDNKRRAIELQEAHRYAEALMQCVDQPMLVLDGKLRVRRVNRNFVETFRVSMDETEERFVYDLGNGQWDIPQLRELLEQILPRRKNLDDYRVTHEFPQLGRRTMVLCARAVENPESGIRLILLAIKDITPVEQPDKD